MYNQTIIEIPKGPKFVINNKWVIAVKVDYYHCKDCVLSQQGYTCSMKNDTERLCIDCSKNNVIFKEVEE